MKQRGKIAFQFDRANDLVIAEPHWHIETPDDALAWSARYEAFMKQFDRKMDLIVVLDDFDIGPTIGVVWGESRAKILSACTRFNYRVRASKRVKLFVNTSGVRYNVGTDDVATVAEAIEGIKAARLRMISA